MQKSARELSIAEAIFRIRCMIIFSNIKQVTKMEYLNKQIKEKVCKIKWDSGIFAQSKDKIRTPLFLAKVTVLQTSKLSLLISWLLQMCRSRRQLRR